MTVIQYKCSIKLAQSEVIRKAMIDTIEKAKMDK